MNEMRFFFFFFTYIEIINKEPNRVFPECLVVIWCLHCYALGSIPDQETETFKLCHEANKRKEKKKKKGIKQKKKTRRTERKFCSLRLH